MTFRIRGSCYYLLSYKFFSESEGSKYCIHQIAVRIFRKSVVLTDQTLGVWDLVVITRATCLTPDRRVVAFSFVMRSGIFGSNFHRFFYVNG